MQAIILAAGIGSRLKPLTNSMPKTMVEISGKPMIEYTFDELIILGVKEVVIVVGYRKESIQERYKDRYKSLHITYIENELYRTTNNVYSLYLTKSCIEEDVLLIEGDVLVAPSVLDKMIGNHGECCIMVSKYEPASMNGTVVTCDSSCNVKELIIKRDQIDMELDKEFFKTVNIYYFTKDFYINQYIPLLEYYVNSQTRESYYELVLGALIYFGNSTFKAIEVTKESWYEIDDLSDYQKVTAEYKNYNQMKVI